MRLLIFNYEYPPLGGGGGIETRDLAEELAKRHEVQVITTGFKDLPRKEIQNGVTVHRIPVWGRTSLPTATLSSMLTFFPAAFIYGFFVIFSFKPECINAHFVIPSGLPAALLSKLFRIPFVLTLIGGDIYDPSKGISPHKHGLLRFVVGFVSKCADKLTAISNDTKKRAIEYHKTSSDIEVIPLGLVPPTVTRISKEELGWREDFVHLVSIGRLVPRKGYGDLLKSFAKLQNKNSMLHILGDGPLCTDLKKEAEELGIQEKVVFHGRVSEEEKYQLLFASDIYVSASHHEGFGICFLEAMFAGLPIITTDKGGQTDFLSRDNAVLIPVGDKERLTSAMDEMMVDDNQRETIGSNNARDVKELLIDKTAQRYEAIFKSYLKNNG